MHEKLLKIPRSKILPLVPFLDAAEDFFPVPLEPYVVHDPDGRTTRVLPALASYEGMTVVAGDWIPVTRNGETCLEQIVHAPDNYLRKKRSRFRIVGDAIEADVPELRRLPGRATLIGGTLNYYHWLLDHLPRLALRTRFGPEDDDVILLDDSNAGFQAEALELMGWPASRVMRLSGRDTVQFDEVLVPALLTNFTVVHPAVPSLLREALQWKAGSERRRVYLTRAEAATRRVTNEDRLMPILQGYGFERMVPGRMTLREQMALFAEAEAVVAVHGAALSNLVFCRSGTQVFEIYTTGHRPTFFQRLAPLCGCPHRFVPGASVNLPPGQVNLLNGDVEVDLDAMKAALAEAFGG